MKTKLFPIASTDKWEAKLKTISRWGFILVLPVAIVFVTPYLKYHKLEEINKRLALADKPELPIQRSARRLFTNSIAFGVNALASESGSIAIGKNASSTIPFQLVIRYCDGTEFKMLLKTNIDLGF